MTKNKSIFVICIVFAVASCTQRQGPPPEPPSPPTVAEVITSADELPVPGTVNRVWEEPMYDQIKVPGTLDPTATYYRPPHKTIVEIRPGRHQPVEFPPDENVPQR